MQQKNKKQETNVRIQHMRYLTTLRETNLPSYENELERIIRDYSGKPSMPIDQKTDFINRSKTESIS